MVEISKEEAEAIRAKYGDEVYIAVTNRHKKSGQKNHYVEETSRVLGFLDRIRKRQLKRGA